MAVVPLAVALSSETSGRLRFGAETMRVGDVIFLFASLASSSGRLPSLAVLLAVLDLFTVLVGVVGLSMLEVLVVPVKGRVSPLLKELERRKFGEDSVTGIEFDLLRTLNARRKDPTRGIDDFRSLGDFRLRSELSDFRSALSDSWSAF